MTEDPFWAEVHRRHPDVDLVLLPPEPPPDPPPDRGAEPLDGAVVRTDLETVRAEAAALALDDPEELVELGTMPGTVRAVARAVSRGADRGALDRLEDSAASRGWHVRRQPGAVELLLGRSGRLALRASYAPTGVLVVAVTGPERVVGDREAMSLTGER